MRLKFRLHTWLLYLFVLLNSTRLFALTEQGVKYDTVFVKTVIPTKEKEAAVFKEVNLDFARKVENKDIGLWGRFWKWLKNSLFGGSDASEQNARTVFFWFIAIAGVAIIIWLLTRTEFTSFLRGNTKKAEFSFSDMDEDISGIDFNDRINKAFQEQDAT